MPDRRLCGISRIKQASDAVCVDTQVTLRYDTSALATWVLVYVTTDAVVVGAERKIHMVMLSCVMDETAGAYSLTHFAAATQVWSKLPSPTCFTRERHTRTSNSCEKHIYGQPAHDRGTNNFLSSLRLCVCCQQPRSLVQGQRHGWACVSSMGPWWCDTVVSPFSIPSTCAVYAVSSVQSRCSCAQQRRAKLAAIFSMKDVTRHEQIT